MDLVFAPGPARPGPARPGPARLVAEKPKNTGENKKTPEKTEKTLFFKSFIMLAIDLVFAPGLARPAAQKN